MRSFLRMPGWVSTVWLGVADVCILFTFFPLRFIQGTRNNMRFRSEYRRRRRSPLTMRSKMGRLQVTRPFLNGNVGHVRRQSTNGSGRSINCVLSTLRTVSSDQLTLMNLRQLSRTRRRNTRGRRPTHNFRRQEVGLFRRGTTHASGRRRTTRRGRDALCFVRLFRLSCFLFLFIRALLCVSDIVVCELHCQVRSLSSSFSSVSARPNESILDAGVSSLSTFVG